jgi:hypothetical protein
MSKMIDIFFNKQLKSINCDNNFQKFQENCLEEFNLNRREIKYYEFYIIKDNKRENITNQFEYDNLVYNNENLEIVFFELNEDEDNNDYDIINNNNDEIITLKNELMELYSILIDYQKQLIDIEEESKSFLELEQQSKKNFLEYKSYVENQLNDLQMKINSFNNNSEQNQNIMISEIENNDNNNSVENQIQNISHNDSSENYSCIFIIDKEFEVNVLNIDNPFIINLKIKNNGNIIIPQNWNIKQFNKSESIFKIKDIDIKNEIKVNEEISIKMEVEIKNINNINYGINSFEIALIHKNIGQISNKEVIKINIKKD